MRMWGTYLAIVLLVASVLHMIWRSLAYSAAPDLFSMTKFQELINAVSVALAMIVVASPDGLPLAISIGLAFQNRNKSSIVLN